MKARGFLENPVLVAVAVAVLALLLTAGQRMSTGVWFVLGVAVFLGSMKGHELITRRR